MCICVCVYVALNLSSEAHTTYISRERYIIMYTVFITYPGCLLNVANPPTSYSLMWDVLESVSRQ